jgi:hypothetical protein
MSCTITKLTDREQIEHWRVLVAVDGKEVMHDSASTKKQAIQMLVDFLKMVL